tara:strand:- start:417 stop:563 length:147 start_codon:yes stop_codon:yes gene_type:complete
MGVFKESALSCFVLKLSKINNDNRFDVIKIIILFQQKRAEALFFVTFY